MRQRTDHGDHDVTLGEDRSPVLPALLLGDETQRQLTASHGWDVPNPDKRHTVILEARNKDSVRRLLLKKCCERPAVSTRSFE
jgi:hypothetical protein